jgi:transposase InsO family protein
LIGPDVLTGETISALWSDVLERPIGYAGNDLVKLEQGLKAFGPAWLAYDIRLGDASLSAGPRDGLQYRNHVPHEPAWPRAAFLSRIRRASSRYIIAWKLCTNMRADDVTDTLDLALKASGCDSATVLHKPRLLSDNGPSYIASELAEYIEAQKMSHVRGAPMHPQTQGKIERWHQTLKNRILLENYFLPGDLEIQIEAFVEHYNHQRYHESLNNVTPADACFGRAPAIIKQRERIKRQTIELRRLQHRKLAA